MIGIAVLAVIAFLILRRLRRKTDVDQTERVANRSVTHALSHADGVAERDRTVGWIRHRHWTKAGF